MCFRHQSGWICDQSSEVVTVGSTISGSATNNTLTSLWFIITQAQFANRSDVASFFFGRTLTLQFEFEKKRWFLNIQGSKRVKMLEYSTNHEKLHPVFTLLLFSFTNVDPGCTTMPLHQKTNDWQLTKTKIQNFLPLIYCYIPQVTTRSCWQEKIIKKKKQQQMISKCEECQNYMRCQCCSHTSHAKFNHHSALAPKPN